MHIWKDNAWRRGSSKEPDIDRHPDTCAFVQKRASDAHIGSALSILGDSYSLKVFGDEA